MANQDDRYRKQTRLIQGKMLSPHWDYNDHVVPPISASTAYRLKSTQRGAEGFHKFANKEFNRELNTPIYIYDRFDEPVRGMLEENLETAEGGEACVAFATGMAAISGALGTLLKVGDTLVSHRTIYGCTYSLFTNWFPRLGIEVIFTDLTRLDEFDALLTANPGVMVVYGETPCNPSLELLDLQAIAELVKSRNATRGSQRRMFTVIDNTFATPFCQRPLEQGIDIVVESLTKNIGGFGTDMGGAVIVPRSLEPDLLLIRKDFGGALAPKAAWTPLVFGLPTLALRSRQQIDTALRVAKFLERQRQIERVVYPGLESHPQYELAQRQMRDFDDSFAPGIMIYFILKGSGEMVKQRGARFMDRLAEDALSITLAVSLGQIRTLIEHPASMTHAGVPAEVQEASGLHPGGIRLSIGLEHPDDIISDLGVALETI